MAARSRKIRHDEETRAKIQASQLINRLTDHVLGFVDMTATQVTAALGLLKKTLPDLAAVEHSGSLDVRRANEMTDDELATIAARSGDRAIEAEEHPPVTH